MATEPSDTTDTSGDTLNPLPSTPIGNGDQPPVQGGNSWDSLGYDPNTWDAQGNYIGPSSVNNQTTGNSTLANILKNLFGGGGGGANGGDAGLQALLKALAGVGGALGGHALAQNAAQQAVPPQLTSLMNMGVNRAQYQNPLFQAVNSGVYQMLPNFAKTGNPGLDPSILNRNG